MNLRNSHIVKRVKTLGHFESPSFFFELILVHHRLAVSKCSSESHTFDFPFPGVKNADENELHSIASEPGESHVYNVADFNVMSSIVGALTKTVCEQVEQQDKDIKQSKGWVIQERKLLVLSDHVGNQKR